MAEEQFGSNSRFRGFDSRQFGESPIIPRSDVIIDPTGMGVPLRKSEESYARPTRVDDIDMDKLLTRLGISKAEVSADRSMGQSSTSSLDKYTTKYSSDGRSLTAETVVSPPVSAAAPPTGMAAPAPAISSDIKRTEYPFMVFTDGACPGNGKEGSTVGWSVYIPRSPAGFSTPTITRSGRLPDEYNTNNIGELVAIGAAVDMIGGEFKLTGPCVICTDSEYAMNCIIKWYDTWKKNGWKTADGKTPEHIEVIKYIREAIDKYPNIDMLHVEGHAKRKGWISACNTAADKAAVEASKLPRTTAIPRWLPVTGKPHEFVPDDGEPADELVKVKSKTKKKKEEDEDIVEEKPKYKSRWKKKDKELESADEKPKKKKKTDDLT